MATILIAGLINLETTVAVDAFPLSYQPVRFPFHGIQTRTSGVGYNLSAALTRLGHQVRLAAMVGQDELSSLVQATMAADGIDDRFLLKTLPATPQSVILFEPSGRRQIHVDLKDIQEATYPDEVFQKALDGVDLALVCNINFARRFLGEIRTRGIPIATDVHTINSLDDPYNRDFMEAADFLFCSDEQLPVPPEQWAEQVMKHLNTHVLVVGCGAEGSMLVERDKPPIRVPAVSPRPVHNTIGAGDALLSGFIHGIVSGLEPETALHQAAYFAGWKIGEASASRGFLTAAELREKFCNR
ncbi:MAG: carbohydrate kinase family protein [Verrucomicrobia bacterium]|nr:carbohydrate kinase family protein [Verrucomicrobiota bacterium]